MICHSAPTQRVDVPDKPLEFEFVSWLSSRAIDFFRVIDVASGVDPGEPRGTSSSPSFAVSLRLYQVSRFRWCLCSRSFVTLLMSDGSCVVFFPSFGSYKTHRWAKFVLSFRLIRVPASFRWLPSSSHPLSPHSSSRSALCSHYRSDRCSARPARAFRPFVVRRVLRRSRFRSVRSVGCCNRR